MNTEQEAEKLRSLQAKADEKRDLLGKLEYPQAELKQLRACLSTQSLLTWIAHTGSLPVMGEDIVAKAILESDHAVGYWELT